MERSDIPNKASREAASVIGRGILITGNVESTTDLQIEGRVNGEIRCATLFVEDGGIVMGTINADRVRISGTVEGTINAGDLAIEATAKVKGEISYTRMKVSAGGVLEGSFNHRAGAEPVATPVETGNLKLVEAAAEPAKPRRVYID